MATNNAMQKPQQIQQVGCGTGCGTGADAASKREHGTTKELAQGNKLGHTQATTMTCGTDEEGMQRLLRRVCEALHDFMCKPP